MYTTVRESSNRKSRSSARRRLVLEGLETRWLMATFQDIDVTPYKSGPLAKAGQTTIELVREYQSWQAQRAIGNGPLNFSTNSSLPINLKNEMVEMEIAVQGNFNQAKTALVGQGVQIGPTSIADNIITGMVPIAKMQTIANLSNVASMRTILLPVTNANSSSGESIDGVVTNAGAVVNQADAAQNAPAARTAYSVTGAGVKVGVISDSVNRFAGGLADSRATGDLGAVQIIQDGPTGSSDEGRAMLELVKDIAPGSPLAFATAFVGGQTGFANNIDALRTAGSKVIVDDISYFAEPMFQPGVIDLAIKRAVDANIPYFSSAGNSGLGYEAVVPPGWTSGEFDFNPAAAVDRRMQVTFSSSALVVFQWDEPYNGLPVPGKVDTDIDIGLLTASDAFVAGGFEDNIATRQPVEFLQVPAAGTYQIALNLFAGAAPGRLKMVSFGGSMTTEYGTSKSSTFGHNAGPWTIGVGAVPFFNAPPFANNATIATESFSSAGPSTYVYDGVTPYRNMNSDIVFRQPFISGIDNVNTTFFIPGNDIPQDADTRPNFSGTSAAAPNVAAVAALMKQKFPTATVGQIAQALADSARPVNGTAKGVWNSRGGYGLVNAKAAMDRLQNMIAAGHIVDNNDPNAVAIGTWTLSTSTTGYGGDLLTHARNSAADRITYTFNHLAAGTYNVYTTYVPATSRATNVRYELSDGDLSEGAVLVNQRVAPAGLTTGGKTWKLLKQIVVSQGLVTVRLLSNSGGTVSADAVLLRRVGAASLPEPTGLLAAEGEAAPPLDATRNALASTVAAELPSAPLRVSTTEKLNVCVAAPASSTTGSAFPITTSAPRKPSSLAALDSVFDKDLWLESDWKV